MLVIRQRGTCKHARMRRSESTHARAFGRGVTAFIYIHTHDRACGGYIDSVVMVIPTVPASRPHPRHNRQFPIVDAGLTESAYERQ